MSRPGNPPSHRDRSSPPGIPRATRTEVRPRQRSTEGFYNPPYQLLVSGHSREATTSRSHSRSPHHRDTAIPHDTHSGVYPATSSSTGASHASYSSTHSTGDLRRPPSESLDPAKYAHKRKQSPPVAPTPPDPLASSTRHLDERSRDRSPESSHDTSPSRGPSPSSTINNISNITFNVLASGAQYHGEPTYLPHQEHQRRHEPRHKLSTGRNHEPDTLWEYMTAEQPDRPPQSHLTSALKTSPTVFKNFTKKWQDLIREMYDLMEQTRQVVKEAKQLMEDVKAAKQDLIQSNTPVEPSNQDRQNSNNSHNWKELTSARRARLKNNSLGISTGNKGAGQSYHTTVVDVDDNGEAEDSERDGKVRTVVGARSRMRKSGGGLFL